MNSWLIKKYISAFLATIVTGLIGIFFTGTLLLIYPEYQRKYYATDQAFLGHFYLAVFVGLVYSILWLVFFGLVKVRVLWKSLLTATATSFLIYLFSFVAWGMSLSEKNGVWFLMTVFVMGFSLPLLHNKISRHLLKQN